jgi:hypothetical protein
MIDQPVEGLPTCAECGALERPGVVWFGGKPARGAVRARDPGGLAGAGRAGRRHVGHRPAGGLAGRDRAARAGATVIEVNPEASPGGRNRIALVCPAGEVLPELLKLIAWP